MKGKPVQLILGAINIVTHPHSSERYLEHFITAIEQQRQRKASVRLRGETHGIISNWFPINQRDALGGIEGEFLTFFEIGDLQDWHRLDNNKPASEIDVRNALSLPGGIRPKGRPIRYVFYPREHILIYAQKIQNRFIAPNSALKLVKDTLNFPSALEQGFPVAEVTLCQSREEIERLLASPHLKKLEIAYGRPNPDDHAELEKEILRTMEKQGADLFGEHLISTSSGRFLSPDDNTKAKARVASRNGFVYAEEIIDGKKLKTKTSEHPAEFSTLAPIHQEDLASIVRRSSQTFLNSLTE